MSSPDSGKKSNLMNLRVAIISILVIAVVVTVLAVSLINKPPQYYSQYGVALGTNVKIVYATDKGNSQQIVNSMFNELNTINQTLNPWLKGSELYDLNNSNGKWMKVSPNLLELLKYSLEISNDTNGAFDPTVGRLVQLWGFNTDDSHKWHLPSQYDISQALLNVGYQNVQINGDQVRLMNGVWLDLGGIAKGYAVQLLVELAKENDPNSTGYVDIGGDIGIIGPKYGDQPWIIGVRNPAGTSNDAIEYVKLYKGFIATSGDYERYIMINGKRYYHILDPKSGYSNDYFQSVSTISSNGMLSDAFGTAIMVAGPSMLDKWAGDFGVAYYAIYENGNIQSNTLWKEYESQ